MERGGSGGGEMEEEGVVKGEERGSGKGEGEGSEIVWRERVCGGGKEGGKRDGVREEG